MAPGSAFPRDQWKRATAPVDSCLRHTPLKQCPCLLPTLTQGLGSLRGGIVSHAGLAHSQTARSSPKGCPTLCISFCRSQPFCQAPREKQFLSRARKCVWKWLVIYKAQWKHWLPNTEDIFQSVPSWWDLIISYFYNTATFHNSLGHQPVSTSFVL